MGGKACSSVIIAVLTKITKNAADMTDLHHTIRIDLSSTRASWLGSWLTIHRMGNFPLP